MCSNTKNIPKRWTSNLMAWFERHRRHMPWREGIEPYRIWVSEVMLQQTRVSTVIDYFNRWMEAYPTVHQLAEADIQDVLKLWEGLGYYSRARNLLKGAKFILGNTDKRFPEDYDGWMKVPGVGPYIAAAVVSIAYNQPVGVVDGNVKRVMARLFALKADSTKAVFSKQVRSIVETSYNGFPPRWVNQAWMEFGALQCVPKPDCADCPLIKNCAANRDGDAMRYPVKPSRKKPASRSGAAFIIRRRGKILFLRRPESGLLGGLWELPNVMFDEQPLEEFINECNIDILSEYDKIARHEYSHFRVSFQVYEAKLRGRWKHEFWIGQRWAARKGAGLLARPKVHIKALEIAGLIV